MRILYISSLCGGTGGSVALKNLVLGMKERGHDVAVFFPQGEGWLLDCLRQNGVRCICGPWYSLTIKPNTKNLVRYLHYLFSTIYHTAKARRALKKCIEDVKPDIVHTNVGPLDIALDACKKVHVPHIWHQREYQDKDFDMHFLPSQEYYRKKILKAGNYNLSITKDIFNYWNLRKNKDRVVYDGVFSGKILPIDDNKYREDFILFVGAVTGGKGADFVLDAYIKFIEQHSEYSYYKLVYAGDIFEETFTMKSMRAKIASEGLGEKVIFLGYQKEVYPLMQRARMLVVGSKSEGFGFITVEAMLNHCPVVGRYAGGTKEQADRSKTFEGGSIMHTVSSSEEAAKAMYQVLTCPQDKMVARAYKLVTKYYTTENCVAETEKYYHFVLKDYRKEL